MDGETQVYEFDTSECEPPEPMVNAMSGLLLIDSPNKRLDMINHKKPMGLLEKIGEVKIFISQISSCLMASLG